MDKLYKSKLLSHTDEKTMNSNNPSDTQKRKFQPKKKKKKKKKHINILLSDIFHRTPRVQSCKG